MVVSETEAEAVVVALQSHKGLLEALQEISEGKGRYNRDQLKHAENTIEDMKQLALDAIAKVKKIL